ncbi:hypothetical protein BC833DRAFT_585463 [Globomyces pollinis-pini]|nr:hypothetical protein BC833DRAFT_585463 [Globomyces pollinis-pini]KAJ3000057.1 hypothetical protein HDV02_000705 [Globomyces sp. JEL0801]
MVTLFRQTTRSSSLNSNGNRIPMIHPVLFFQINIPVHKVCAVFETGHALVQLNNDFGIKDACIIPKYLDPSEPSLLFSLLPSHRHYFDDLPDFLSVTLAYSDVIILISISKVLKCTVQNQVAVLDFGPREYFCTDLHQDCPSIYNRMFLQVKAMDDFATIFEDCWEETIEL